MHKRILSHLVQCLLASGGVCLLPSSAFAATDAAPAVADTPEDSAATTQQLGAVTVTAQKREQDLQKVPVAVSVVNSAQIESNGIRDFTDLNRIAPSLVIKPAENPVNASVTIRGIGTFAFSIGVEPSVAVVVDDVPIAFQARAFTDLSDIDRIEVLRGPQSTLYGKSASAGLINIVTAAPTDVLTTKVSGLATGDGEYSGGVVFSGPLTEHLGFRSTVNYDDFGGNVRNLYDGHDVNGRRILSTRNKLVWDPTDALNVTLGFDYIDGHNTVGRPFYALSPTAALRSTYPQALFAPGVTVSADNTNVVNNFTSGTNYKDSAGSLKVSYDFGGPTLMSITSIDTFKMFDTLDQDESGISKLDNRQFGTFGSHQTTEELRLISPAQDRFRYTLGLFYADVDYSRNFGRGPYYSQAAWFATSYSTQYAGFGQLEYDILPDTTLIVGGRESSEKIGYTFDDFYNGNKLFSGSNDDDFATYKVGVQQQLSETVMLFLTNASGHKGETYDLGTGFNATRAAGGPVKPETSNDWEVGARMQFLDRRLTLNTTLFDTKYKDFQAQGIELLADGTTNFRLANVGRITTRGAEVESALHVNEDLGLGGSVTYLDSKITNFPFAQCYPNQTAAQGCLGTSVKYQDLAGARPPLAPKWKVTANFDYSHPINSSLLGVVTGALVYQSRINYSLSQDPLTIQDGYTIANFSVGVRQPDGRWEVMAFVNNAFDKHYYQNIANSSGNYGGQLALQSYLPRDFERYAGVRATYKFD